MRIFFTLSFLLATTFVTAQNPYHNSTSKSSSSAKINFNGQWRGGFDEKSDKERDVTYVLELDINGSVVGGYSYTYFNEPPHKYYTICRITGTLNRNTGDLVVTEVERLKHNTPPTFINCFQTHRLHYIKEDENREVLRGTWIPAPNQSPGCGSGTTILSKRITNRTPMGVGSTPKNSTAMTPQKRHSTPKKPQANEPRQETAKKTETAKATPQKPVIISPPERDFAIAPPVDDKAAKVNSFDKEPETRRKDIVKTITIEQPTFRLDFYDNGQIDGDSISVYYNGKVVLSKQMLTDKPLSLVLELDKSEKENILTMYAENLGSIPPNTAVMIVTDGKKRYEVRMESDLKKSGSVVFKSTP